MAYYLSQDREADVFGAYRRYQHYLHENRSGFPPGAYELATAEWWQDPRDHKCPHDSWLEKVVISEIGRGERSELRHTGIQVRLFGAYHDGFIELQYPIVYRYSLNALGSADGLGDWLCDEFTLSSENHLVHEIEWERGRWIIEASDIAFRWIPA
ncbi:MAG: hypothetical protein JNN07_19525 [Verrucomicrobiales bacterium]|nr:hypothetical protein [Verrucomicrobiales bacterium]